MAIWRTGNPPPLLQYVGRLGSEPHPVGRIGSGVHVSANFQKKIPRQVLSDSSKGGGVRTWEGFAGVTGPLPFLLQRLAQTPRY